MTVKENPKNNVIDFNEHYARTMFENHGVFVWRASGEMEPEYINEFFKKLTEYRGV